MKVVKVTEEQKQLIDKIENHPGGDITFTQEECSTLADIILKAIE